jgi:hypothetical protein
MSMSDLKILEAEDLVPILRRTAGTIKADARRRPQTLPPRLRIPGSSKLIWLERDVIEWLEGCREKASQKAATE